MDNHFETGLEELRQKLLLMASRTESAVNDAVRALMQRDHDLALKVRNDDDIIDELEIEIDEMAILLLTKAPLASNLRLVTVAMKVCQNLERIGDEATKIAKRARDLAEEPPVKIVLDVPRLASMALRDGQGILGFICSTRFRRRPRHHSARQGGGRAQSGNAQLPHPIHGRAPGHHRPVPALDCGRQELERIADHAKNIAEEVVYLCEAQDIRHHLKKMTLGEPPYTRASASSFCRHASSSVSTSNGFRKR